MKISVFCVLVLAFGLFLSRTGVLKMQVLLCIFGGTAAITLTSLGDSTIVVPVLCLPFLVARAWLEGQRTGAARSLSTPGFLLAATVLWGIFVTLLVPRWFEGRLEIMAIDRTSGLTGTRLIPLRPVSGNLTQSVYALGNVAMFVSGRYLLRFPERLIAYRDAVLGLAALNCLAAVINLAEYYLHLPSLLAYVRTAYAVFETGEARGTGLVRIHGTFSETSAFSSFSLTLFGFTASLWLRGVRPWWSGLSALLLLTFLLLSTSGTAYAGLMVYGSIVGFSLVRRGYRDGRIPRVGVLMAGGLFAAAVVGAFVMLESPVVGRVYEFFDITVLRKMESESGQTRSAWNAQALQNFLDTYGLGVGIGSARASSFLLVLLSNVGAVGTVLYLAFLWTVLVERTPGAAVAEAAGVASAAQVRDAPTAGASDSERLIMSMQAIREAACQALLASLTAALLSGASFDRGPAFYLYAAAASLRPLRMRVVHGSLPRA